ncbi:MAG: SCO1664 family protein [Ilumatobacteraceae bacterium]
MTHSPLDILTHGEIDVEGRMPYSSNGTFLVTLSLDDDSMRAIYKPLRGERPLWDFPAGLYKREIAAYRLSAAMGFDLVPLTIERDGPGGIGSLQAFVDADFTEHYFTLYESRPDLHDQFRRLVAFDIVANNTDRKSGHCLVDASSHVWAIDNGLCFAADFKLRTVIWEFGGEPIPVDVIDAVRTVADSPPLEVAALLDDDEIEAMIERAMMLAEGGMFPIDSTGRRYPWPVV